MQHSPTKLWPYDKALAFVAIPVVWTFFVIICMLGKKYAGWQNILQGTIVLIIAAISCLPLLMLLLDFFSERKAVLDFKGVKLDFSKINLDAPGIKRESFRLPDNIGITGPIISDTSPMDIIKTLERAVDHEVVVLNLKSGEAWWTTRLLALSAGAVRAGSPLVFVFIGKKENMPNTFLGFAKPANRVYFVRQGSIQDTIQKSDQNSTAGYSIKRFSIQWVAQSRFTSGFTGCYNRF